GESDSMPSPRYLLDLGSGEAEEPSTISSRMVATEAPVARISTASRYISVSRTFPAVSTTRASASTRRIDAPVAAIRTARQARRSAFTHRHRSGGVYVYEVRRQRFRGVERRATRDARSRGRPMVPDGIAVHQVEARLRRPVHGQGWGLCPMISVTGTGRFTG